MLCAVCCVDDDDEIAYVVFNDSCSEDSDEHIGHAMSDAADAAADVGVFTVSLFTVNFVLSCVE